MQLYLLHRQQTPIYRVATMLIILFSDTGRERLARENEAGGSWGQEVHILHVDI